MKKNQKGQALIELIIFLPIMFTLYALISGFANAINGSINQQKIARSYFYFKVQNNSNIIRPKGSNWQSWTQFGNYFIGWKEYFQGGQEEMGPPMAPCYRISFPIKAAQGDVCEGKYTNQTTQFIRVKTVYGACGGSFRTLDQLVTPMPDYRGGSYREIVDPSSCLIQ